MKIRQLIIGIRNSISALLISSLLITLNACQEGTVEPSQRARYEYVNKTGGNVRFEIYNSIDSNSFEYNIANNASIHFSLIGNPIAFPFYGDESDRNGDSVVIRFPDNHCAHYKRDNSTGTLSGNGVFNLETYDNFSIPLINQDSYQLIYSIDSSDYNNAVPCL